MAKPANKQPAKKSSAPKGLTRKKQAEVDAKIVAHISKGMNYYQLSLNSEQLLGVSYNPHSIKKHFYDGIATMYGVSKPEWDDFRTTAMLQIDELSSILQQDFYTADDPEVRTKIYGAISKTFQDRMALMGKPSQVQVQFIFNTDDLSEDLKHLARSVPADYVIDQDGNMVE